MRFISTKDHTHKKNRIIGSIMLSVSVLLLAGCGNKNSAKDDTSSATSSSQVASSDASSTSSEQAAASSQAASSSTVAYQKQQDHKQRQQRTQAQQKQRVQSQKDGDDLDDMNYQSGQPAYLNVNNGQSTLNPKDWKINNVEYSDLDNLNRTSAGNTAYLEGRNVANDSLRTSQTFKPTGYQQKFINNEPIINRGHEIAYSLSKGISANGRYEPKVQSGDQDNPKNLFTQTAFSNQKVQTIYESKVRNALKQGKQVIYQVKPVFSGNDLMAKGVHMQAISTDKSLDYNVYLYNVQPGVQFDYTNGRSKVDRQMNVPTPAGAPSFKNDSSSNKNTSYHNNSKHHYLRDAAIAGTAHHFIKRHYQKKYNGHTSHHALGKAVVGGSIIHHYAHKY